MTRRQYIEQLRRQIYGGFPNDDAEITVNLVNLWVNQGIGVAVAKNYDKNLQLEGISYVNNSFYTTYKNIAVTKEENFLWKVELPHLPYALGTSDGISFLSFKDPVTGQLSKNVVWLSQNQRSYAQGMRPIPNSVLAYSEGGSVYVLTSILMNQYTASVTMVSGGDSTDLDSVLNVPDDYFPIITEYVKQQLQFQRMQPVDETPDGLDAVRTV